jgi:hypothetical protein
MRRGARERVSKKAESKALEDERNEKGPWFAPLPKR